MKRCIQPPQLNYSVLQISWRVVLRNERSDVYHLPTYQPNKNQTIRGIRNITSRKFAASFAAYHSIFSHPAEEWHSDFK
ncbi:hypothetical protein ACT01R_20490 [Pseudomonas aeruginosa]|uniref:hypothetical protein n=1 Tax=Pseudomonas aeruginosa TaxID=287 RepID=UPI0013A5C8A6|nr:hypothetical protein [Pseudomonas aeruginosa]EKY1747272.1 hypothetical protein [Pseudomonas aeruginosa]HEP8698583.1 hypothetical protein [Pseudomonas aeruginosa]